MMLNTNCSYCTLLLSTFCLLIRWLTKFFQGCTNIKLEIKTTTFFDIFYPSEAEWVTAFFNRHVRELFLVRMFGETPLSVPFLEETPALCHLEKPIVAMFDMMDDSFEDDASSSYMEDTLGNHEGMEKWEIIYIIFFCVIFFSISLCIMDQVQSSRFTSPRSTLQKSYVFCTTLQLCYVFHTTFSLSPLSLIS